VRQAVGTLLVVLLSCAGRASAHGAPPAATELLAAGDGEASLVRLTPGGLALRVPGGFRFVCPEAWGGDVLAPAASIPRGPTLVASDTLFVIEQDGSVSPHPVQSGSGGALASHPDAVFGLFAHDGRYELRRVTGSTNELVRVLDHPFGALAARADEVVLLRWFEDTLELQKISLDGTSLGSVTWSVPNGVAYARVTAAAEQLYVTVWGRARPWVTLGRVNERGYEPLREASVDIAGPSASTWVLLDGTLQRLDTGAGLDTLGRRISCLGDANGLVYACSEGDLYRLEESGLGAPLFELGSLLAPTYDGLAEPARASCSTRWLDLRADVAAAQALRNDIETTEPPRGAPSLAPAEGCSALPASTMPSLSTLLILLSMVAWRARAHGARRPSQTPMPSGAHVPASKRSRHRSWAIFPA
jgi:hypothetical protein